MRPRYLDPATGSYVIQMLVAGALGVLYAVRGFFFGTSRATDESEDEDDPEDEVAPEDESEDEP